MDETYGALLPTIWKSDYTHEKKHTIVLLRIQKYFISVIVLIIITTNYYTESINNNLIHVT